MEFSTLKYDHYSHDDEQQVCKIKTYNAWARIFIIITNKTLRLHEF